MADSAPISEVDVVQNAAFGATLLWQFGLGFQSESEGTPACFLHYFLVLPVCLHRPTLGHVLSTQRRSGLAIFASKVGERREELVAFNSRGLAFRALTLRSLGLATRAGLLTTRYSEAIVRANSIERPRMPRPPELTKDHIRGAERFGAWCGRISIGQTAALLRVEF